MVDKRLMTHMKFTPGAQTDTRARRALKLVRPGVNLLDDEQCAAVYGQMSPQQREALERRLAADDAKAAEKPGCKAKKRKG